MHNLIGNQTSKRVSKPAANQLGEQLQQYVETIAEEAISIAEKEGYQTVQEKHIREALQNNTKTEHQQKYNLKT
jgi:histone H3/H4